MMLVCAGMIGVGKSTLTEILAREFGTQAFYEEVENNPVLDKFYEDPKKWAFSLQMFFLDKRFKAIKKALSDNNNVLDRSIYEDALFTRINNMQGNISDVDLKIYNSILDNMMEELKELPKKAPDLLIYLEADFDTILDHIKQRGRDFEQIDDNPELLDYYKLLWTEYKQWYEDYNYSPKMKIKVETYNPNDKESIDKVIEQIKAKLKEVRGEEQEEDLVNHPKHYTQNGVETIDVIERMLGAWESEGYYLGNIVKYLDRCEYKGNKEQDLKKAQWYLKRALEKEGVTEGETVELADDYLQHLYHSDYDLALSSWKDARSKIAEWILEEEDNG